MSPGVTETCNSVDDDCDGSTDESLTTEYYADADGDGYGDPSTTKDACTLPTGYVLNASDCDDTDSTVLDGVRYYADADGDGYGDPLKTEYQCDKPKGYVEGGTD